MAPARVLTAAQQQQQQQHNKLTSTKTAGMITRRGTTTRSQNALLSQQQQQQAANSAASNAKDARTKRKAETSPLKDKMTKRSALGNITNAISKTVATQVQDAKKIARKVGLTHHQAKCSAASQTAAAAQKPCERTTTSKEPKLDVRVEKIEPPKPKPISRLKQPSIVVVKEAPVPPAAPEKPESANNNHHHHHHHHHNHKTGVNTRRSATDSERSNNSSLYVSALEEVLEDTKRSSRSSSKESDKKESQDDKSKPATKEDKLPLSKRYLVPPKTTLPDGVEWDFDAENWADPYQVPQYAMDIFNYLKERESTFPVGDYIDRQVCLSRWMRSLLVDWMVAVQESFELNHETLYLAVKLVDLYLTKVTVSKETLQLLGAASLFIASKFDERIPPMIEDFVYICDGAYTQRELMRMEISILKIMNFDLGIPLSYRFLRRYARCAKVSMPTLTLARYILEYSLMDYSTIRFSDSKMAAASLLIAMQMKDIGGWTSTMEYYTGYKVVDFADIARALNDGLHRKQKEALATVRNKYSHKIFFEVAKVPLKDKLNL